MMRPAGGRPAGAPVSVVVDTHTTRAGYRDLVRFLQALQGAWTHWGAHAPEACRAHQGQCAACKKSAPRWHGYAAAELWDSAAGHWRPVVYEATAGWEETVRGRHLRGEEWLLYRVRGKGKFPRLVGELQRQHPLELLRPPWPLEPILTRLMGGVCPQLGVANPSEPRMAVEVLASAAPELPPDPSAQAEAPPDAAERARVAQLAREMADRLGRERTSNGPAVAGADGSGRAAARPDRNGKH